MGHPPAAPARERQGNILKYFEKRLAILEFVCYYGL